MSRFTMLVPARDNVTIAEARRVLAGSPIPIAGFKDIGRISATLAAADESGPDNHEAN